MSKRNWPSDLDAPVAPIGWRQSALLLALGVLAMAMMLVGLAG